MISDAAGVWNAEFKVRGTGASAEPGPGDLEIIITDQPIAGGVDGAYLNNTMWLSAEAYENTSREYIVAVLIHELGHAFGFQQVGCAGQSVMSDTNRTSYRTAFTNCDVNQLNGYLGIRPRRDDDNDGYSPDDPPHSANWDCHDDNIYVGSTCPSCGPDVCEFPAGGPSECGLDGEGYSNECGCCLAPETTPIIIDLASDGFDLTNRAGGVGFDLNGDGKPERLPWTAAGADDGWLVLDRNGNGTIDTGAELFSNFTVQPLTSAPNGYLALAVFDENRDTWIDSHDAVFSRLRVWVDSNHNGASETAELTSLAEGGLLRISVDYRESRRQDRHGNWFRYRAKVVSANGSDIGRFSYDVYLSGAPKRPK